SSGDDFLVHFTWWQPPGSFCFFPVPALPGAHALRLSPSLDRIGAEIEIAPADAVTSTPVAWNGSEYLALAVNYDRLDGVRVARDGKILGRTRVNPDAKNPARAGTPSVAAAGEDFIIAWREISGTSVV